MEFVVGSVDPYPFMLMASIIAIPVISIPGWLIWRASMRRGLWILIVPIMLSIAIAWWRGPVWIWAVMLGAVVLSLVALALPAPPDSRETRHRSALADGKPDLAYCIIPALISLMSIAPLIAVVIIGQLPEEEYPTASAEGVLHLSPEDPIAVVDVEVTLSVGVTGELAQLAMQQSMPFSEGIRRGMAPTLVFPVRDGIPGPAAPTTSVYSTLFTNLNNTCAECSYRYLVVYALDPTYEQPIDVDYQATFSWGDEIAPPAAAAADLPAATITATPASGNPHRIISNLVTEDTQWAAERPFDLRMVSVDVDPELIPESGLASWPALERRVAYTLRQPDQADAPALTIDTAKELDPTCLVDGCTHYSYIVPILDAPAPVPAEELSLEVIHWIDYLEETETGPGAISVTTEAPGAWLEEHDSGVLDIESTDDYLVELEFDVGSAAAAGIGAGIGRLTVSAPPETEIHMSILGGASPLAFPLNACEQRPPCSVTVVVHGQPGDRVTWDLNVDYGFFGVSTMPDGAAVSFAPPRIETRS